MVLAPGKLLGPYQIVSSLGSGATGEVYRAVDTRLDRSVAIKVLTNLAQRPQLRVRFEREARVVSRLIHPNICLLFDIGRQDDLDYLVLEYLEGETLAKRLNSRRLSLDEVVKYSIDIVDALREAHSKGFIHRDIKPANIFITNSGTIKILDFGLATLAIDPQSPQNNTVEMKNELLISRSGLLVGTVLYMSPEQVSGNTLDSRTDLFSFGIVLYEMVTGILPFNGNGVALVFNEILNCTPKPPDELVHGLPPRLIEIIGKTLEKNRSYRYASASDLRTDLVRLSRDIESGSFHGQLQPLKPSRPPTSMAVLPFLNLSLTQENEYFGDGLAEDLINALARIEDLHVASRTSAFSFKGKNQDTREIGRKLGVDCLVEGSVRKSGERLRITVRLVSVANGYELWSERYDVTIEDEFTVQDQITEAIVNNLKLQLKGGLTPVKRYTDNHDAYHLYLKGRFYWNKMTEDGYRKGFSYAEQAIAKDPGYALAYAGLADSYSVLGINAVAPAMVVFPKAKAAAMKALELDNSVAEAHMSLALAMFWHDWDWAGAEAEFLQSIELSPRFVDVYGTYAWFLTLTGRPDEAVAVIRRGQDLDPLSLTINVFAAWMLAYANQLEAAIDEINKVLEMDRNFVQAYLMLGETYVRLGKFREAIEANREAVRLGGGSLAECMLGYSYAVAGQREQACTILTQLIQRAEQAFVGSLLIALVYAGLRETDSAIEWIEKAYRERDGYMVFLNRHPFYDSLRSDPRFQNILQRLNFPEARDQSSASLFASEVKKTTWAVQGGYRS
jgi:serine/threonine protein kinase/Tfp pilus assembly protein PilF